MNRRLFAAPLFSLALVLIFLQPLQKSNLVKRPSTSPNLVKKQSIPLVEFSNLLTTSPATILLSGGKGSYADPLAFSLTEPRSFAAEPVTAPPESLPFEFQEFIDEVQNGEANMVRGVQVPGAFSLPVVLQPDKDATYVSTDLGVATLFRSAARNGVTGLLAHNYLSGDLFYKISLSQDVFIVYGDGSYQRYQVTKMHRFQKLEPNSLRSDLIDLETGVKKTTAEVFKQFYGGGDHVTFQTCLAAEGISNWGLYFVVAELPEN